MDEYEVIPAKVKAFSAAVAMKVQGVDVSEGHWVVLDENGELIEVVPAAEFIKHYRKSFFPCVLPHMPVGPLGQIGGSQIGHPFIGHPFNAR